jgi:hypothetical protein
MRRLSSDPVDAVFAFVLSVMLFFGIIFFVNDCTRNAL